MSLFVSDTIVVKNTDFFMVYSIVLTSTVQHSDSVIPLHIFFFHILFHYCLSQDTEYSSLGWEDPLEKGMQPTPVFLPGELHGQRSP